MESGSGLTADCRRVRETGDPCTTVPMPSRLLSERSIAAHVATSGAGSGEVRLRADAPIRGDCPRTGLTRLDRGHRAASGISRLVEFRESPAASQGQDVFCLGGLHRPSSHPGGVTVTSVWSYSYSIRNEDVRPDTRFRTYSAQVPART